jgi:hypothetical protein
MVRKREKHGGHGEPGRAKKPSRSRLRWRIGRIAAMLLAFSFVPSFAFIKIPSGSADPVVLCGQSTLILIGAVSFVSPMKKAEVPLGAQCCREYPYHDVTLVVKKFLRKPKSMGKPKAVIVRAYDVFENPAHFTKGENVLLFLNDDDYMAKKYGPSHWMLTLDSFGKFSPVSDTRYSQTLLNVTHAYDLHEIEEAVKHNLPSYMQTAPAP